MDLKIQSQQKSAGHVEIALEGRLDTKTYGQLEELLKGVLAGKPRLVNLNMEKLDYISSMGLRVLVQTMKTLKASGGQLALTNLKPPIQKVIDIARVLPDQSIFRNVAEADAYFDAMQKKASNPEAGAD